jgi:DNA mismatch repair protein MutS
LGIGSTRCSFLPPTRSCANPIRKSLRSVPDIGRALSRLSLGRGGPRDLAAIRDGLVAARSIRRLLSSDGLAGPPQAVQAAMRALEHHDVLVERLAAALSPDLPLLARDGGFIAKGLAPELDELRMLRDESRRHILNLEAGYRSETGTASLKIRHNNVLGYYIEVTRRMRTSFRSAPAIASFTVRLWLAPFGSPPSSCRSSNRRSSRPPTRRWRSSWRCSKRLSRR